MMPAANNGVGMNIGFPDVCLTPAGPAVVPIPYPNIAANAMAVPFSPNIRVGFMPALNMGAKIPLTNGDNAGVAHPFFMQMGQYTMGNPLVFVNCMPAVNLLCPTTGNMMNNPIGAVLVPSVTVTFYTDASQQQLEGAPVSAGQLGAMGEALRGEAVQASLDDGVATLAITRFTADVSTQVWRALRRLGSRIERVVIDLRANPGGDAEAALALADDFVEPGTVLAIREDAASGSGDVDRSDVRARQRDPYRWPLSIRVDEATGSAAELFAGALWKAGRATLVGGPTAGKASSQTMVARGGRSAYQTVCRWRLADGTSWEGVGLRAS